jgi:hypothetical protein
MAERSYHRQGAMYLDGIATLTGIKCRFGLVAVENTAPYGVMSALVRDSDIELGRRDYRRALQQIASSRASGVWPGYTSPTEWSLPGWATREAEAPVTLTIAGQEVHV